MSFPKSTHSNSEQSNKGKVKTHKYINRQNQSTTEDENPTSEAHDSDTNISDKFNIKTLKVCTTKLEKLF
jgi:hypothetical protein